MKHGQNESKECPLCGENMRLKEMDVVDLVPGTTEGRKRKVSEWICPECDYFEEVEPEGRR